MRDLSQHTFAITCHTDGHINPHRRTVGRFHPGMVGDREEPRERLLGGEVALDDPARERLGERVGGDEAEAARTSGVRRVSSIRAEERWVGKGCVCRWRSRVCLYISNKQNIYQIQ